MSRDTLFSKKIGFACLQKTVLAKILR